MVEMWENGVVTVATRDHPVPHLGATRHISPRRRSFVMAVEVCHDAWRQVATMYCNTSDTAFGPIFTGPNAGTEAEDFLDWMRDGNGHRRMDQQCSIGRRHRPARLQPDELRTARRSSGATSTSRWSRSRNRCGCVSRTATGWTVAA